MEANTFQSPPDVSKEFWLIWKSFLLFCIFTAVDETYLSSRSHKHESLLI